MKMYSPLNKSDDERSAMSLQKTGRMLSPDLDVGRFCWTMVEHAPDPIIYADTGGMIRFWNHAAERIFGFSEAEVLGKSLDVIIPENLRKRHWAAYLQTMRTGHTRYGEGDVLGVPAVRKDGTRISIEFSILLFRNRQGHMLGAAAILRDVTRRFEVMKALRREVAGLHKRVET